MESSERSSQLIAPLRLAWPHVDNIDADIRWLDEAELPLKYQQLLVHEDDMTSTLSRVCGAEIGLNRISQTVNEEHYWREVFLVNLTTGEIVEYGTLTINLHGLEPDLIEMIRESKRPLGGILRAFEFNPMSRPQGYFSIQSSRIETLTRLSRKDLLYGRCSHLYGGGRFLANVVEILP